MGLSLFCLTDGVVVYVEARRHILRLLLDSKMCLCRFVGPWPLQKKGGAQQGEEIQHRANHCLQRQSEVVFSF